MNQLGDLPRVALSLNEFKAIDSVLAGYLKFLSGNITLVRRHAAQIWLLNGLRQKLAKLLLHAENDFSQGNMPYLPITFDEVEATLEAMKTFIRLVSQVVPASNTRARVLSDLEGVRQKLAMMQVAHPKLPLYPAHA